MTSECKAPLLHRKAHKLKRILAWVISAYLIGFVPLFVGGGYELSESGELRLDSGMLSGMPVADVAEWQPLFGFCQIAYHWPTGSVSPRCDLIGWLYYPLIYLVKLNHPAIDMFDADGHPKRTLSFPHGFRSHPRRSRGELVERIYRNGMASMGR